MKTITEYLSGEHDEELCVLVAEARGWRKEKYIDTFEGGSGRFRWKSPIGEWVGLPLVEAQNYHVPPYPTSLDASRELLEDLTDEESLRLIAELLNETGVNFNPDQTHLAVLRATARQICVAWLITKRILK